MKEKDLLNVADFFVIIFRGKWVFIVCWLLVMTAAVAYLSLTRKTYKLEGTLYVGRFQETLLEEGEFVAAKLRDYSFMYRALQNAKVELDIPINRLTRLVTTEVLNEVKKTKDVGLVKLSVEYKGQEKVHQIFKALTDQLILDHQDLLRESSRALKSMEQMFWDDEEELRESLTRDEAKAAMLFSSAKDLKQMPNYLLLAHTISEKRNHHNKLVQDIHYLKIETESASKSYNTRLASEPEVPDDYFKPKLLLTLILAVVLATVSATVATLGLYFFRHEIQPKLSAS